MGRWSAVSSGRKPFLDRPLNYALKLALAQAASIATREKAQF
jgi:hypothetical protein